MKPLNTIKKEKVEKKEVKAIEIHIYVHQLPNLVGAGYTPQCTCLNGATAVICPIHLRLPGTIYTTC